MEKKEFVEREWNDQIKGELDEDGFFTTPNGSFWDPDYVYFNREGYDKHGGYYDDNLNYIPGEGWDEIKGCYQDEESDDDYNEEDVPDENDKKIEKDFDVINKGNEKEHDLKGIHDDEEFDEEDDELSEDEKNCKNDDIEIIKVKLEDKKKNKNKNKNNDGKGKKYVNYNNFDDEEKKEN